MRILLLTKTGRRVGFGHVQRCRRIARRLQHVGDQVAFAVFCPPEDASMLDPLLEEGLTVRRCHPSSTLSEGAEGQWDAILADLGDEDVRLLTGPRRRVVALDCYREGADAYVNILPDPKFDPSAPVYSGYQYWLLEPSRHHKTRVRERIERILISCGFTDPLNLASRAVENLRAFYSNRATPQVRCVVTSEYDPSNLRRIRDWEEVELLYNLPSLEEEMLEADVLITAGGNTMVEGLALALPTVVIPVGARNAILADQLEDAGFLLRARDDWMAMLARLQQEESRTALHHRCLEFDGFGIGRVIDILHGSASLPQEQSA
ncbi:MAG TPA: hypothetical protein VLV83_05365 [Acidobacteriota bacterium]|nr:hypothetical protein [Acidobacteriota bacterium]